MYLFDESKSGIVERDFKLDLFFILRVTTVAGIFVGLALGGVDIFLNRMAKKKHSFRFYILIRSLFYLITFSVILSVSQHLTLYEILAKLIESHRYIH